MSGPEIAKLLKKEPPETHFFLTTRPRVLHGVRQLELLAHLICTESGFPTFTSTQTSESEVSSLYYKGRKVSATI